MNKLQITPKSVNNLLNNCKKLAELRVSQMRQTITDSAIEILIGNQAENLKKLDFTSLTNVSSESLISLLKKATSLQVLYLSFCNNINKKVSKEIVNLKCIRELYISRQKFLLDECVESISLNCPNLVSLNISKCPSIGDKAIASIFNNLPSMRILFMANVAITEKITDLLKQQNLSLECLELCGTNTADSFVKFLCNSKKLRVLNVAMTNISGKSIPLFNSMKELKYLNLTGTRIEEKLLVELCPPLEELDLSTIPTISRHNIQNARQTEEIVNFNTQNNNYLGRH